MNNVTIILQGKVLQDSLDFYIKNYPTANLIVSTWVGSDLNLSNLPESYNVILSKMPKKRGDQNVNLQLVSTLNALRFVKTDYVIKIRGDEYYSNLEYVAYSISMNPNKVYCTPVWFRHWSFMKFHISDHMIAGKLENVNMMFEKTKFNIDNELITHIVNGAPHRFWEPEINFTRSYLMEKEPNRFGKVDGRQLMVEHFDILDIKKMYPYRIVANVYKAQWTDEYVPELNYSISNIQMLFNPKEKAYDTNIPQR
jgi:hypothetical protein